MYVYLLNQSNYFISMHHTRVTEKAKNIKSSFFGL